MSSNDEGWRGLSWTRDGEHFKTVESVGRTYHSYSRRDEHFDIFLCRDLNQSLHTVLAQHQEVGLAYARLSLCEKMSPTQESEHLCL